VPDGPLRKDGQKITQASLGIGQVFTQPVELLELGCKYLSEPHPFVFRCPEIHRDKSLGPVRVPEKNGTNVAFRPTEKADPVAFWPVQRLDMGATFTFVDLSFRVMGATFTIMGATYRIVAL
jgi:hypothetical protein